MKTKITIILFALSILFLCSFKLHKHYVSLSEVKYLEEKKELQIVLSLFPDDLETAILSEINSSFDIDSLSKEADADCFSYLKRHFQLESNGKQIKYKYLGKEFEGDKILFYLEASNIKKGIQIKIKNTLLIKQFSTQKNVVKTKNNNKYKSFYLNNTKHFAYFNL